MDTVSLYEIAETNKIQIFVYNEIPYISMCVKIGETDAIALTDQVFDSASIEKVCIAHELGHCVTNSFYNIDNPLDVIEKHERRADKWAIKKLVTEDELHEAVSKGCTELWQLAEYFDIPQDFMEKIVRCYEGLEW